MKKNILLIGVGGTGSNAVDTFNQKLEEFKNQTDNNVTALVFDTDAGDLKKIKAAKTVEMADPASVGTICDRIGKEYLKEWFPWDSKDVRSQEMMRGASQWRKKSYLAFLNLMNKPTERRTFISALEDMVKDPGAACEVYVIASVAGGTGSGSFIPIALYAKRYLRNALGKNPIVNAMIALPDIYADSQTPENTVKIYSNAYAILRELNAINLVTRNYNAGVAAKKKAPIKFRIGHPDEPNVGLLFDASDRRFWTPEAAPFSQIFLLDRIPGLNSVAAHDMVLANSLYTMICTEIGAAFDSEFSNHELVRSQNNGSNAVYAGVSSSQIRFPSKTILDYLAHKQTLESCDGEWLTIHKSVENAIREKEREAKAAKRRFTLENDAYANLVLEQVQEKIKNNNNEVISIVERCVDLYDKTGKRMNTTAGDEFLRILNDYIEENIPNENEAKNIFAGDLTIKKDTKKTATPDKFVKTLQGKVYPAIFGYFKDCFDKIKSFPTNTADAVITLDKRKIGTIGDRFSIIEHLLKTEKGTFIHPVAALIRLCEFRVAISEKLDESMTDWPELSRRNVLELPDRYFEVSGGLEINKSAYKQLGKQRFKTVFVQPNNYKNSKVKTNVVNDIMVLKSDAEKILSNINTETTALIEAKIFKAIARDVDILIAKYRAFFNRFEKEKRQLFEDTLDIYRRDVGHIDSAINVYSTEKDKDSIKEIIDDGNGPLTDDNIRDIDNIVGKGVLDSVMASAIAESSHDENFNENDSTAYRSLFSSMVDASRESIVKSDAYKRVASYNTIEAIVESCGDNATEKQVNDALRDAFSNAQKVAVPSLKLITNFKDTDLVTPSQVMVFMISLNTARYIKRNAEKFNLSIPADQTSESSILRSCSEQFIRNYSGNSNARVAIVKTIPDQILYCTGEIMDITPLCIAKFDELSNSNPPSYFDHYTDAIKRYKKYETDMWNPHLGENLHKRGYLPFMNPAMEDACDEKMIKALLYGFATKTFTYKNGTGVANKIYYYVNSGVQIDYNSRLINNKNISNLLDWLRNQDELVEDFSAKFDKDIEAQMNSLPTIVSDTEIGVLEGKITQLPFMRLLNNLLYTDPTENGKRVNRISEGVYEIGKKAGPTAVEFAHIVRKCEELDRDCDDAERILRVLYKVFYQIIAYRTSPETNREQFITVYKQQLNKFYEALACIEVICDAKGECENYYREITDWLTRNKLFMDISIENPTENNSRELAINVPYEYNNNPTINTILKLIRSKKNSSEQTAEQPAEVTDTAEAQENQA